jgi:hypothetical protein
MIMNKLSLILVFLSLTRCNFQASGNNVSRLKAVYLVHGQGELSSDDLRAHPEVVVVQTFDEFKQYANQKVALWIDQSATPFTTEQQTWINEAPQAYNPIVLVGYSDTLYSFRDLLGLCCFMGPPIDGKVEPGFSVIQREETNEPDSPGVSFLQGYHQQLTVQTILEITNALLEGRLKATPTATFTSVATATMAP